MSSSLRGHRVVVTGASSGIGLATSRHLAREGARLALMARSPDGLAAAARAVADEGSTAVVLPVDVTDRPAVEAAMARAAAELGGIDGLVPCAAALAYGAFTDLPAEDFDRCHDVTFRGAVNTIRAALGELERSGGTLVAVVSVASKVGMPLYSPYVAAKFGLRGFLDVLRLELRHRDSPVEVCMVHPGFIGTPFFDHATSTDGTRPSPLPPVYRPEDVAEAVVACLKHPRRELHVGGSTAVARIATSLARPLADLVRATYVVAGQRRRDRAPAPGMLWEPSGAGRADGSVSGRRSLWAAASRLAAAPLDALDTLPGVRGVLRRVR